MAYLQHIAIHECISKYLGKNIEISSHEVDFRGKLLQAFTDHDFILVPRGYKLLSYPNFDAKSVLKYEVRVRVVRFKKGVARDTCRTNLKLLFSSPVLSNYLLPPTEN